METIAAISGYYDRGGELDRLTAGRGRLEFLRTQDVLRRLLPPSPARVLDVGGGTGVHARWRATSVPSGCSMRCAPWSRNQACSASPRTC
jgi:ubiquinone/menaquinone biosynthesis C-methylase UbiE